MAEYFRLFSRLIHCYLNAIFLANISSIYSHILVNLSVRLSSPSDSLLFPAFTQWHLYLFETLESKKQQSGTICFYTSHFDLSSKPLKY